MKVKKVTDDEIKGAFLDNFTSYSLEEKKTVLAECILKIFCGYSDSYTAIQITQKLGLLSKKGTVLKRGKDYLMDYYYRLKP